MIECDGNSALGVDSRFDDIAHTQFSGVEHAHVRKRRTDFLRVAHGESRRTGRCSADEFAGIANLAAAFRIKRRVIEHHLTFLARPQCINHGAVENQRCHDTLVVEPIVARKVRLPRQLDRIAEVRAELARRARTAPLRFHRGIETGLIDA